ncbi:MAG: hypothetical protein BGO31_10620 [Bacteroidetes bacterium 43-16]|nr:MAG: hypothetical protein BGO31_10620 [Bacteroidetes bacterium 43-16]
MEENKAQKRDLETLVGNTLRYGVWISFALSAIGLVWLLFLHPESAFAPEALPLVPEKFSFGAMIKGLSAFNPAQIAMLGSLVLLLTPLLRVVFALFGYWKTGNKLYTFITLTVLVIIWISVLIGVTH